MLKRIIVLMAVTSMFVGVVGPPGAGAAKPDEFPFEFADGPYPWDDLTGAEIACKDGVRSFEADPDFIVLHQVMGEGVHKHFLTKGGEVVKHQTWIGGTDYLINSETGEAISGHFNVMDIERTTLDVEPLSEFSVHGLGWHVVVPGYGTVFLEAGTLTLDFSLLPDNPFVSFNGRSDLGAFEYDAVCASLS